VLVGNLFFAQVTYSKRRNGVSKKKKVKSKKREYIYIADECVCCGFSVECQVCAVNFAVAGATKNDDAGDGLEQLSHDIGSQRKIFFFADG
jgi:hypothetical protein